MVCIHYLDMAPPKMVEATSVAERKYLEMCRKAMAANIRLDLDMMAAFGDAGPIMLKALSLIPRKEVMHEFGRSMNAHVITDGKLREPLRVAMQTTLTATADMHSACANHDKCLRDELEHDILEELYHQNK
jgi:hypothetical protein